MTQTNEKQAIREILWRCDAVPQYEAHKEEIDQAIQRVLRSGRYVLAENVAAFETEFAEYLGCPYAVGVGCGTDALMLALGCLNLKPDDEVITTPFTAIPTYMAIRQAGARAVFVDIDPQTFLLDLNLLKGALTKKTRAVVPVHLFGNAVDIERLREISGPDIFIVEDSAQAHGASVRGKKCGSMGDVAIFSFYPTKNLGGYGDGGMVVTHRKDFAETLRVRRRCGMINNREFVTDGVNSRLDELQAAVLRVKLKYLDTWNERRLELAALYRDMLPLSYLEPQAVRKDIRPVYLVYSVLCRNRRDELAAHLKERNVETSIFYPMPLTQQRGYRAAYDSAPDLPVCEDIAKRIISLPFYPEIPVNVLAYVAQCVTDFYSRQCPSGQGHQTAVPAPANNRGGSGWRPEGSSLDNSGSAHPHDRS